MTRRWKWTRARYEHARRLSRLLGRLATERPITPPAIVEAYWALMRSVWESVDPMDGTHWDHRDIPF